MNIKKVVIQNFKSLRNTVLQLNPDLNIIVGDNEAGKSTLLEAVHLAMSGQLNGRNIQYELTPYLFNVDTVNEYLNSLKTNTKLAPPTLLIEAYLENDDSLARLQGSCNSLKDDCPGLSLKICFNEDYNLEYQEYIATPSEVKTIPVEYYKVEWFAFSGSPITSRVTPLKTIFIDTSVIRVANGTDRYMTKVISSVLDPKQRVELALSYRKLKDEFQKYDGVKKINEHLATKKGDVTDKNFSISMDMSAQAGWESSLAPHLDEIPFAQSGKGEQNAINTMLAIEASTNSHILLIEEPENHLSYSNMSILIGKIREKATGKQLIIATHSSFVLNKLGIEKVILFGRNKSIKLETLTRDTQDYFMKLPGHNTLRLILAKKAILVEGPSDELIVQRAFVDKYGVIPLERGVDIISVDALAFKRFLEIGKLLSINTTVVTDNDGNISALETKYQDYLSDPNIRICYDANESYKTLEPQLLRVNSLATLNCIFGKNFSNDSDLLYYMSNNKTDCALKIFNSPTPITYPEYINNAIS